MLRTRVFRRHRPRHLQRALRGNSTANRIRIRLLRACDISSSASFSQIQHTRKRTDRIPQRSNQTANPFDHPIGRLGARRNGERTLEFDELNDKEDVRGKGST